MLIAIQEVEQERHHPQFTNNNNNNKHNQQITNTKKKICLAKANSTLSTLHKLRNHSSIEEKQKQFFCFQNLNYQVVKAKKKIKNNKKKTQNLRKLKKKKNS